jgi:nitroreductase/SAM-dependent methyltransferase
MSDDPRLPDPSLFDAIHARRSVRRFDLRRPVPDELVLEVIDAARYTPSSCNLQTWDFVIVSDPELRKKLAAETKSVLIAPVTIFVVYDRELARDGLANVQSASAAVMTLLLAATGRGLASLWVNALGDRDVVRSILGVPDDYEVLALVCLGYPLDAEPPPMPERRPLGEVIHRERYLGKGSLPRSPDPDDWSFPELGLYFKRKLQSGTRYNKPVASFCDPVLDAVRRFVGEPRPGPRLLDVLPGTALFTELLHSKYPDADLGVAEFSAENHFFANRRCGGKVSFVPFPHERAAELLGACAPPGVKVKLLRESGGLVVMPRVLPYPDLASAPFDAATILFRLEGIPRKERERLLREVTERLAPGGRIVIAYVSRRSWHLPAYAARRRMGRNSVEYAPVPEPNIIGPYEALSPGDVKRLVETNGLRIVDEARLLPLPDVRALETVGRRTRGAATWLIRIATMLSAALTPFQGLLAPFSRVRVLCLMRRTERSPS